MGVANRDAAICTTSAASVSTRIDPVTASTLLDREVLDIDGKETCKRRDGDVEQEQHREAIGLEVDPHDRSQLEIDEEKQDVVEPSASGVNHFQVVRRGGPDNRGPDHEQRDELKAAHQPSPSRSSVLLRSFLP
jgi:hypothetical protein